MVASSEKVDEIIPKRANEGFKKKILVETIVATLNFFVVTTSVIYNWTDVPQKGICLLITLLLLLLFITFIYWFG